MESLFLSERKSKTFNGDKMGTPKKKKGMVANLAKKQLLALVTLVMVSSFITVRGRGPQTIDIDVRIREEEYETYRTGVDDTTS